MTDPTERPDGGSINEATRRAVEADRARVVAAERAARRRRSSLAGRAERVWRWLRNRQSGPLPRARRVGGVLVRTVRDRGPWRSLPEALATALLAPVRLPGKPPPPRPPRDWAPERAAAADRIRAFAARADAGRLRVAVIADAPTLEGYRLDWDVVDIRPEDWASVLAVAPPDLLVVDAARSAGGGAWAYRIAWTAHPDFFLQRDLEALVGWAASRSIPAVFRARAAGAVEAGAILDSARLFDLVLAANESAMVAFEAIPDRRGMVAVLPSGAGKSDGDGAGDRDGNGDGGGAAVIRAIRSAA